jgi:hypothetical protein
LALSLLLHAGMLYVLHQPARHEQPAARDDTGLIVWIAPQPSPSIKEPLPATPPRTRSKQTVARRTTTPLAVAEPHQQTPQPTQAPSSDPLLPADPFASAPASPEPPRFDKNAALKAARKLATAKSTRDDPAVAQIYDKPLYGLPTDTPTGQAVARTARGDCKNVASGTGILALVIVPLMILTDKKDAGCKW